MFKKRFQLIGIVLLTLSGMIYSQSLDNSQVKERGMGDIQRVDKDRPASNNQKIELSSRLNNIKSFQNVKPQNTFVFLVGNDNYDSNSGFGKLDQAYNDARLLKSIFINCAKVDPSHVYAYKDLTLV